MSLLQDIISEATAKDSDATRLLRNCVVLAARLPHPELGRWALQELQGYAEDDEVPLYRILECRNRGRFHVPGWTAGELEIPLGVLPAELRDAWRKYYFRDSIAECQQLTSRNTPSGQLQVPWPVELAVTFGAKALGNPGGRCERAWMEISASAMVAILDIVKTKVLSFALEIEASDPKAGSVAGVAGEVPKERLDQVFQTVIYGSVGNLAQGSNQGIQTAVVAVGDKEALHEVLASLGFEQSDAASLDKAIDSDRATTTHGKPGARVKAWLGEAVIKLATKSVETGTKVAVEALVKAVMNFFGAGS